MKRLTVILIVVITILSSVSTIFAEEIEIFAKDRLKIDGKVISGEKIEKIIKDILKLCPFEEEYEREFPRVTLSTDVSVNSYWTFYPHYDLKEGLVGPKGNEFKSILERIRQH